MAFRHDYKNDTVGNAELVVVRRRIADLMADRGERDDAAKWQNRSLDTARGKPELLYELAVDYARNAGLTGKLPTRLNPDQLEKRRLRFVAGAVATLRQAAADGFKDAARLKKEATFDSTRSDSDFGVIVADIEFPAQAFAAQ